MKINASEAKALLKESDFSFLSYLKHPKRDLIKVGLSESLSRNACLFLEMFMETILVDPNHLSAIYLYRMLNATTWEGYAKTLFKISYQEDPTQEIREALYRLGEAYLDAKWRQDYFRSLRIAYSDVEDVAMKKFLTLVYQGACDHMARRYKRTFPDLVTQRIRSEQDSPTNNQHWVRRLRFYSDNIEQSDRKFQYFIADMRRQNNNLPNARQFAYDFSAARKKDGRWNVMQNIHCVLDDYLRYTAREIQSLRPTMSGATNQDLQNYIEAELTLRVCKYKFDLLHHYVMYYTTPVSQEKSLDQFLSIKLQNLLFGDAYIFSCTPMCIERYQYASQQLARYSNRQALDTALKVLIKDDGDLLVYYRELHLMANEALNQLLHHYARFTKMGAFSTFLQHDTIRYVSQQVGRAQFLTQGVIAHNYILRHYESGVIDYFVIEALVQQAIRRWTRDNPQYPCESFNDTDRRDIRSTEQFYCRHVVYLLLELEQRLRHHIPENRFDTILNSEGPIRLATILNIVLPMNMLVNNRPTESTPSEVNILSGIIGGVLSLGAIRTHLIRSNENGIVATILRCEPLPIILMMPLVMFGILFCVVTNPDRSNESVSSRRRRLMRSPSNTPRLKIALAVLLAALASYWAFRRVNGASIAETIECDLEHPALCP